eukprot:gene10352-21594_t
MSHAEDPQDLQEASFSHKNLRTDDVRNVVLLFSNLVTLDLSNNFVEVYPSGPPQYLTALNLSHNLFAKISGFERLSHLVELNLSHNKLQSTWGLTTCLSLQFVDFSYNKIHAIEGMESLTALSTLKLSNNNLRTFSSVRSLSFNRNLLSLDLSDNPLTELVRYRGTIFNFVQSLQTLDGIGTGRHLKNRMNQGYISRFEEKKSHSVSHPQTPLLYSDDPGRWVVRLASPPKKPHSSHNNTNISTTYNNIKFQQTHAEDKSTPHKPPPPPPPEIIEGLDLSAVQEKNALPWRRPPDVVPRPWKGKDPYHYTAQPPPPDPIQSDRPRSRPKVKKSQANESSRGWNRMLYQSNDDAQEANAKDTLADSINNGSSSSKATSHQRTASTMTPNRNNNSSNVTDNHHAAGSQSKFAVGGGGSGNKTRRSSISDSPRPDWTRSLRHSDTDDVAPRQIKKITGKDNNNSSSSNAGSGGGGGGAGTNNGSSSNGNGGGTGSGNANFRYRITLGQGQSQGQERGGGGGGTNDVKHFHRHEIGNRSPPLNQSMKQTKRIERIVAANASVPVGRSLPHQDFYRSLSPPSSRGFTASNSNNWISGPIQMSEYMDEGEGGGLYHPHHHHHNQLPPSPPNAHNASPSSSSLQFKSPPPLPFERNKELQGETLDARFDAVADHSGGGAFGHYAPSAVSMRSSVESDFVRTRPGIENDLQHQNRYTNSEEDKNVFIKESNYYTTTNNSNNNNNNQNYNNNRPDTDNSVKNENDDDNSSNNEIATERRDDEIDVIKELIKRKQETILKLRQSRELHTEMF